MLSWFNYQGKVLEELNIITGKQNLQKITRAMACHEADILKYTDIREYTKYKPQKHQLKICSRNKRDFNMRNKTACFTDLFHTSEENEKMWWGKSRNSIKILRFWVVRSLTGQLALNLRYGENGDVSDFHTSNYFVLWGEGFIELVGVEFWHWSSRTEKHCRKNIDQESIRVRQLQVQKKQFSDGLTKWENCA